MKVLKLVKQLYLTLSNNEAAASQAELILASSIAVILPIPAEANGSTGRAYFNANYREFVKEVVNAVNEEYLIDVNETMELAAKVYTTRFNFVHAYSATFDESVVLTNYLKTGEEDSYNVTDVTKNAITAAVTSLVEIKDEYFQAD